MKQRLHLAKALLHDPPMLVLDEPTIGLDPAAAVDLRRAIANLVPHHTVLLTTHDMNEADQLCREIAIINHGNIVAQGTPTELKARVASERTGHRQHPAGAERPGRGDARPVAPADRRARRPPRPQPAGGSELTILCSDTAQALDASLAALRGCGAAVDGVRVVEPTLEDAFLAIAGGRLA